MLLLGYEEQMLKMLREANPGLQRRFSPESAFRFEDFTDAQLEELLHLAARASGLRWSKRAVCKAALGMLVRERIKPNFGNAGAVNSLMGRVKVALAARGDARAIQLGDLGLAEGGAATGGTAATAALLAEVEGQHSWCKRRLASLTPRPCTFSPDVARRAHSSEARCAANPLRRRGASLLTTPPGRWAICSRASTCWPIWPASRPGLSRR